MEITGKVVKILPEQSGQTSRGEWRKQEFILEVPGNYPKSVCISMWGNNIESFGLSIGEEVTASIDIESREYNNRWYTNIKAWKIDRSATGEDAPPPDTSWPEPGDNFTDQSTGEEVDDLPF